MKEQSALAREGEGESSSSGLSGMWRGALFVASACLLLQRRVPESAHWGKSTDL